eukprot:gene10976-7621_t
MQQITSSSLAYVRPFANSRRTRLVLIRISVCVALSLFSSLRSAYAKWKSEMIIIIICLRKRQKLTSTRFYNDNPLSLFFLLLLSPCLFVVFFFGIILYFNRFVRSSKVHVWKAREPRRGRGGQKQMQINRTNTRGIEMIPARMRCLFQYERWRNRWESANTMPFLPVFGVPRSMEAAAVEEEEEEANKKLKFGLSLSLSLHLIYK